jgi:hypothetical protein
MIYRNHKAVGGHPHQGKASSKGIDFYALSWGDPGFAPKIGS